MTLRLCVAGPGGLICDLRIATEATVVELKAGIEERTTIPVACQRLFHGTKELVGAGDLASCLLSTEAGQAEFEEPLSMCARGEAEVAVEEDAMEGKQMDILLVRRTEDQISWLQQLGRQSDVEVLNWLHNAAPPAAWEYREFVLAAVTRHVSALRHVSLELRADREVVCAAASTYRKVVLADVASNGFALQHASPSLRGDREVVFAALARDGSALQFASADLRGDREVVLAAVAQNGLALESASPELQGDREVVFAAVTQAGRALEFASPKLRAFLDLRADLEVARTAMARSGDTRAWEVA